MPPITTFPAPPEPGNVYWCDALSLLKALPDASVDAVITDPPYGIQYTSGHVKYSSGTFGDDILDTSWLREAYRISAQNSCIYLCTRWDVAGIWADALNDAGYKVKQRIVWDKGNWTAGDLNYYASQTEDILFAIKGNPKLQTNTRPSNIWRIKRATRYHLRVVVNPYANPDEDHPTRKPVALMSKMIEDSTLPGDLIVDPFCGSGTTLLAARNLNRRFIGGDITEPYVELARRRLAQPFTLNMFEQPAK